MKMVRNGERNSNFLISCLGPANSRITCTWFELFLGYSKRRGAWWDGTVQEIVVLQGELSISLFSAQRSVSTGHSISFQNSRWIFQYCHAVLIRWRTVQARKAQNMSLHQNFAPEFQTFRFFLATGRPPVSFPWRKRGPQVVVRYSDLFESCSTIPFKDKLNWVKSEAVGIKILSTVAVRCLNIGSDRQLQSIVDVIVKWALRVRMRANGAYLCWMCLEGGFHSRFNLSVVNNTCVPTYCFHNIVIELSLLLSNCNATRAATLATGPKTLSSTKTPPIRPLRYTPWIQASCWSHVRSHPYIIHVNLSEYPDTCTYTVNRLTDSRLFLICGIVHGGRHLVGLSGAYYMT